MIGYNGREETSDWPQLSEEVQVNPGGSHASRNYMWACVILPGVYSTYMTLGQQATFRYQFVSVYACEGSNHVTSSFLEKTVIERTKIYETAL